MRAALLVLLVLVPSYARAQDLVPPAIPPGEDRIVVIQAGSPAPFRGQLFDDTTALRWLNARLWLQERLRLQVALLEETTQRLERSCSERMGIVESSSERERTSARVLLEQQAALAEEQRRRADDPPFFSTFEAGLLVGVVTSVLLVIGAVLLTQ